MPRLKGKTLSPAVEAVFGKVSPFRVKWDPAYEAERQADKARKSKLGADEKPYLRTIPCKRGGWPGGERANIFIHSGTHGGFVGHGVGLRRELLALDGVAPWQTGDQEFSVIFPLSMVEKVAGVVRAIRRRTNRGVQKSPRVGEIGPDSHEQAAHAPG